MLLLFFFNLPRPVTEKVHSNRVVTDQDGGDKNKQLGVTLGDPCESHSIITTVILHTKGPYRNSALSWSTATDMSYGLFGVKQWRLSLSDENN